jgi:hypothetical protein
VTDRRENLRAIFDVENPKEAGRYPFAARRRAVGREPTVRQGHGNNFRSGQTRRHCSVRVKSACEAARQRGMSVRLVVRFVDGGPTPPAKPSPERRVTARFRGTARSDSPVGWEHRERHGRRMRLEGSLEGEQGPGRTGCRAPSKVRVSTDHLAEQGPEGQASLRHRQQRRGWQRQRRNGRDRWEPPSPRGQRPW